MKWQQAGIAADRISRGWSQGVNPGGAIIGFDAQDIRVERFGGIADLAIRRPISGQTKFRFASITKHIAAANALLAQDRGNLDLHASIGASLDRVSEAVGKVPWSMALDMTGGLPDTLDTAWLLGSSRTGQIDEAAFHHFGLSHPQLNFNAGTEFSYSNTGYALLGLALERQGEPLADRLLREFFEPLGIALELASDQSEPIHHLATGYWPSAKGWHLGLFGAPYTAADGLVGTPRDLVRWLQALLADEGVVSGMLGRLSATRHLCDGRAFPFGLGLAQFRLGEVSLLGFGGQLPGYSSQFLLHLETGSGVVVTTNREDGNAFARALAFMAELLSQPLPKAASGELPEGTFATEDGPFWLTYAGGQIAFMGAASQACVDERTGAVIGSAYLPMNLYPEGDGISGEVGYVERRFSPVPSEVKADHAWAGRWENTEKGAHFRIEVSDAEAEIIRGIGVQRSRCKLTPIGSGRGLFEHREGARMQRICLELDGANGIRLSANRSRGIQFARAISASSDREG